MHDLCQSKQRKSNWGQNISNFSVKVGSKSMKNQGCVADAFLERFGAALGCQMVDFGSPNHQNIIKMAPKMDPKSMKNRGSVADAFLERFGSNFGAVS